jgi:4-hydroxy-3-methylbut-2-enyl diphosphate reductase IspH
VVVVGGKASGNTKRLAEVAARGKAGVFGGNRVRAGPGRLAKLGSVGVTAGASTPNWMIKRL